MTKPKLKFVNAETGEEIEREMNAAELKQYEADSETTTARIAEEEAKATAKAALLERLGITADEAALLLG
jgi:hypothetical protein